MIVDSEYLQELKKRNWCNGQREMWMHVGVE